VIWLLVLVATVADLERAVARARPGDDIVVAPGSYQVNLRVRRSGAPAAPVTLRAGGGRVLLSARDPRLRVIEVEGARHWRFVGLALRGSRHANLRIQGGGDIVVRDCEVFDAGKKGIIANADDVTIDGCHIHGIAQPVGGEDTQGIATWGANRLTILRSRIETPGDGVLIGGAGALSRTSRDVKILFNHFHAKADWYGRWHVENAIDVKNVSGLLVAGNVIHHYRGREDDDPMGTALNIVTRDPEVNGVIEDVRIAGNVIADVVRAATIEAADGPGRRLLFAGNVVVSARAAHGVPRKPPSGLFVGRWDGLTVAGNAFIAVDGAAVRVYAPVHGLVVERNLLVGTNPEVLHAP
jgi:hypothetical protein